MTKSAMFYFFHKLKCILAGGNVEKEEQVEPAHSVSCLMLRAKGDHCFDGIIGLLLQSAHSNF